MENICCRDGRPLDVPHREGESREFDLHGQRWLIKRLGNDCWTLYNVRAEIPRCRFGNKSEITQDLQAVIETGKLPGKPGRP